MLFSVLIANYNNSRFLARALESVFQQTYIDWEIVLVDDHSTDEFIDVISAYLNDKRLRVYSNKENYGCGYTKRRCASLAQGDLMGFLDPDDALHREALATMVSAHNIRHFSIVHSTHYICDSELRVKRVAEYVKPLPPHTPYLLVNDGRIHHFACFRKSCYEQTAGISAKNKKAVDQDLYYKLEEHGEVLFIDRPLYYYRIHSGSISNSGKELETTLIHYDIIREACLYRISKINRVADTDRKMLKLYKTRYYKIATFAASRRKQPFLFVKFLVLFTLFGGFGNLVAYCKKLPKDGMTLIRKSLVTNYEIK